MGVTSFQASATLQGEKTMKRHLLGVLLLTGACMAADGDGDDPGGGPGEGQLPIEVSGVWLGDNGTRLSITGD